MSEKLVNFSQLDEEMQHKAVLDFVSFYFKLYKENGLEIITSYDKDNIMNDINYDFLVHQNEDKKEMVESSAKDSFKRYCDLIEKIGQKFYTNGNSEKPWSEWYNKNFSKLDRG